MDSMHIGTQAMYIFKYTLCSKYTNISVLVVYL